MATNIKPKTIFTGDNLPIMRGINSESIDLIYLDPPFNSKANYAAPIGSVAAGAEFKDTWTLDDVDNAWLDLIETKYSALNRVIHAALTNSDKSYLIYMATRLLEMKRILKDTGSIYLHCDPTMSHYLKLIMDAVFGKANFRNEVIWRKYGGHKNTARRKFTTENDVILFYSVGKTYNFNPVYRPLSEQTIKSEYKHIDENGRRYSIPRGRRYRQGIVKRVYLDTHPGVAIGNLWHEKELTMQGRDDERTGYPTQKPLALLDRIIKVSSNEGDVVLDPFCGCATTCVAADRLQRNWIGIDISGKAAELVVERIKADQGLFQEIVARTDIPKRTDLGDIPRYNAPQNRTRLYGEQEGYCNGCGEHFQMRNLEVDHIIAETNGGTDHIGNLQLLCSHCNRVKGDRGQEYLISRLNKD
ncbi:MAG: DNA methyltransferase [Candidatus Poribacteria bacterium]|nr:DNA methyltransferase [Candidatus Poribacteria bacterium]